MQAWRRFGVADRIGKKGRRRPAEFKGLMVRINQQGWRDLKVLAALENTTLNALAVEALNDLLRKHGRRASVENPLID
jgi:predicted HicB family RNase H-like nuclease